MVEHHCLRLQVDSNTHSFNMFAKIVVLAAVVAVALSQADKYPAGVNPALCPNYPHCDNAALHLYRHAAPVVHHAVAAREYPAGVSPAACPNYPYCSNYIPVAAAPAAHFYHAAPAVVHHAVAAPLAKEWPAGVHPATCPNYPYCH